MPNRQPQWHRLYFVLAAFDLLTVSLGLVLTHRLLGDFSGAVDLNARWAARLQQYSQLGDLAVAVNAPGNDVFDSHDVAAESKRLSSELVEFNALLLKAKEDLVQTVESNVAKPLLKQLDDVETAMKEMVQEAEQIFAYFRAGDQVLAGARMATMDRRNAELQSNLSQLRRQIFDIQHAVFAQQIGRSHTLRSFEYVIAALILVMVIAVTVYGNAIARQVKGTHEELEKRYEDLARARERSLAANRVKGEFLEQMGQNIGAPINSVVGLTDLICTTKLDPQQLRYATLLKESGNTLLTQFNELLDFSKREVGKADPNAGNKDESL